MQQRGKHFAEYMTQGNAASGRTVLGLSSGYLSNARSELNGPVNNVSTILLFAVA
jgi:hypothetical protein